MLFSYQRRDDEPNFSDEELEVLDNVSQDFYYNLRYRDLTGDMKEEVYKYALDNCLF